MKLEDLTPSIGTVITDLDLATDLELDLAAKIYTLLHQRGVIFFPNQNLNARQLQKLAHVFGETIASRHPKFGCVDEIDEVSLIINDQDNPPDINL